MTGARLVMLLFAAGLASGCSGARTMLRADHARHAISLSDGLRDVDGSVIGPERQRVVGTFALHFTDWSALELSMPEHVVHDISDQVNRQIEAAGGDAMVDLAITSAPCVLDLFTLLGLLPGCVDVDLVGRIVSVPSHEAPAK